MGKMKKIMTAAVLLSLAVGCTGCGENSVKKEKNLAAALRFSVHSIIIFDM